jgi:hypothetical protein
MLEKQVDGFAVAEAQPGPKRKTDVMVKIPLTKTARQADAFNTQLQSVGFFQRIENYDFRVDTEKGLVVVSFSIMDCSTEYCMRVLRMFKSALNNVFESPMVYTVPGGRVIV